jgi:hypothetical protein
MYCGQNKDEPDMIQKKRGNVVINSTAALI